MYDEDEEEEYMYMYTDAWGTHYTDDFNEILDTPGIETWYKLE